MPESVNGGNSNPAQPPKKELSMEMRLLLAFILMGAVMFVTPYFFKQPPPPKATPAAPAAATGASGATAPVQPVSAPAVEAAAPKAPVPGAISQPALPFQNLENDLFRVTFSNQGGTVRNWILKKYRGNDGKLLDLVNTAAAKTDYPFSFYFPAQKPTTDLNTATYKQTVDPDGLGVAFEFSDGHTVARKTFRFQKNSYLSQISAEVSVDGKPIPNLLEWRGGFGDLTLPVPAAELRALYYDVTANKLVQHTAGDAKNGPVTAGGNFSFAGLADKYFAAVLLPVDSTSMQVVAFKDNVRKPGDTPDDEKPADYAGLAASDGDINHFEFFIGPKDLNLLKRVNPKLEQVVDFGWFSVLAKPLFLVVDWFNGNFVHNFGWAIVLVTIVINFAMFPLKLSNMKSMRKMQALKPQIDAINAKYKNVSMRDPKAADKNQETMDLYKKHGVNPMGGCVPMLLQIPFFIAFYKVFMVSVEMRGAPWLWVSDLSQPEHAAIKILPIVMIASQFIMQKMTPQANADPSQAKMMMFMPLIFGFMFYRFPSGLVLYYLTSNLVNMGQQWFFNHTEAAQEAARSVEPPKKRNGRK
jgi:YidC/Oxa1 family membrane protein insertase